MKTGFWLDMGASSRFCRSVYQPGGESTIFLKYFFMNAENRAGCWFPSRFRFSFRRRALGPGAAGAERSEDEVGRGVAAGADGRAVVDREIELGLEAAGDAAAVGDGALKAGREGGAGGADPAACADGEVEGLAEFREDTAVDRRMQVVEARGREDVIFAVVVKAYVLVED
ncbi:MAG: hypothetical protein QM699_14395 [Amaricoccus sp.]|uniref:hypothetical protein n=1 Tax=Amaricoccus sp. TaxID=1872485 RepID=UPI0039E4702E